jgi:hypothetical protein
MAPADGERRAMNSRHDADDVIAANAVLLHAMWKAGRLGGEVMPEDAHPRLPADSDQLAAYFTLGMALNYQRNSYALWRACTAMFEDPGAAWAFDPAAVAAAEPEALAEVLLRHRVALQPNRHPQIWRRNAEGLVAHAGGSVRALFERCDFDLGRIRQFIADYKTEFPYLCGPKIANYWLYVMSSYLDWPTTNRAALSVAPDRHVVAGSIRLGLVRDGEHPDMPRQVAARWGEVLANAALLPIDLHTPLWLWSRAGFPPIEV